MTAKHDFITDNPHIAYSGKPDTSTTGVMLIQFAIDITDDVYTIVSGPSEKPSEILNSMKDGVIIGSLINITSAGGSTGIVQFIGIDYVIEDGTLIIESPAAQILGILDDEEWTIGEG